MPTIDIPDKICPHCGGIRWYIRIYKKLSASGEPYKTYVCRFCDLASSKKWAQSNIERSKEIKNKNYIKKKGTEDFRLRANANTKRYREKNKDRDSYKILQKQYKQKSWLRDKYKISLRNKLWSQNNLQLVKEYRKEYRKKLPDSHLRGRLKHHFKLSSELITDDCINKYRMYVKAYRQLKQIENEKESN
jgi:hypothetical protein